MDGLAFNALIHNFRPDLFQFDSMCSLDPNARLKHAFTIAFERFNIQKLLDIEGKLT